MDVILELHTYVAYATLCMLDKENRKGSMAITYTLQKAVEESSLSIRTLQYAIARGELESVRVGRRCLIPARSLEEFLLRKRRLTKATTK